MDVSKSLEYALRWQICKQKGCLHKERCFLVLNSSVYLLQVKVPKRAKNALHIFENHISRMLIPDHHFFNILRRIQSKFSINEGNAK